jgi:hypothetical protein
LDGVYRLDPFLPVTYAEVATVALEIMIETPLLRRLSPNFHAGPVQLVWMATGSPPWNGGLQTSSRVRTDARRLLLLLMRSGREEPEATGNVLAIHRDNARKILMKFLRAARCDDEATMPLAVKAVALSEIDDLTTMEPWLKKLENRAWRSFNYHQLGISRNNCPKLPLKILAKLAATYTAMGPIQRALEATISDLVAAENDRGSKNALEFVLQYQQERAQFLMER